MKIHILQHVPFETPGVIEAWIKNNKHEASVTQFYNGDKLPPVPSFDWLIVMGGPMGVNDEDRIPWLKEEKSFIKSVINDDKVVIGICLGAQLIASVLGARVFANEEKEIGWFPVKTTIYAAELFSFLPRTITVFHWHGDTFDLPENALLLAESDACKNQLFVWNEKVTGIQFHLEVTEESVKGMVENCRAEIKPAKYVQTEDDILSGGEFLSNCNSLMMTFLDNLADKYPG
jgi:GMP synthase (glutamine-hydrolysing)